MNYARDNQRLMDPRAVVITARIPVGFSYEIKSSGIIFGYEHPDVLHDVLQHQFKIYKGFNVRDYLRHYSQLGSELRILVPSQDFLPILREGIDTKKRRYTAQMDIHSLPAKYVGKVAEFSCVHAPIEWEDLERVILDGSLKTMFPDNIPVNEQFNNEVTTFLELWNESTPINNSS